ncbi:zinc metalloproteinase nas-36-like [Hydractinia symbiolongicarpus]|uniref:zinc metalloproteinase nas-36-like n=1 Tax=Hydractinia symbiolongicarpus TaxID=13093 RepID=UPI00254B9771|nr:zinc metalloproteinase nas-36-like [Hydractinia symbiolongicarpus]
MDSISKNSCVKFQEIPQTETKTHHIRIVSGIGCHAQGVGRDPLRYKDFQIVSLQKDLCFELVPGTIAHELFHILGFTHEIKRPDRDVYVNIMWENIKDVNKNEKQYERSSQDSVEFFDAPYDYNSIMHYKWYYGTIRSDKPTIVPTSFDLPYTQIGHLDKPTEMDYRKLNLLYDCRNNDNPVSSWSKWGPCLACPDQRFRRFRQQFCSHEDISKCWPDVQKRVKTESEDCDVTLSRGGLPRTKIGSWNKWTTWSICDASPGVIFESQHRRRDCPDKLKCWGSNTQSRPCRNDGTVRGPEDCTFEQGICKFEDESTSKKYFWNSKIGRGEVLRDGPLFDHTTMGGKI